MPRPCTCAHGFPVCACNLGLEGPALLAESNRLSSLAGWPARVSDAAIAEWTPEPPPAHLGTPSDAQKNLETPSDAPPPLPRDLKPRGSLDDAIRLRRECIPCRQRKETP